MSVAFHEIAESTWRCLLWFLGFPVPVPDIVQVQEACGCGLLHGSAIPYVLSCADPPELPGRDDYQIRAVSARLRRNSQFKRGFLTFRGQAAVAWKREQAASGAKKSKRRKRKPAPADPRRKWLYEQCCKTGNQQMTFGAIRIRFNRLCQEKGWQQISTDAGIRQAANAYADERKLHRIPPRQNSE